MRKLCTTLTLCFFMAAAHAQINKGQFLVGGTGSFKSTKYKGGTPATVVEYNLSPNAGYFFINKLAGGLRLSFLNTKGESTFGEFKTNSISVAPFLRYYVLPANKKVNVFADATYGAGHSKTGDISKGSFNFYRFAAGPALFLTPNVALETTVSFDSQKPENGNRRNTMGVNMGFQMHLGK